MWQSKHMLPIALIFISLVLFNGCTTKLQYIKYSDTIHKRISWTTWDEYRKYQRSNKNVIFNGYKIEFYKIKPYLCITGKYMDKRISLRDPSSFEETYGLIPYSEYTDSYTFMMFTLNENPFDKELHQYFNVINQSYENILNLGSINKFVEYECDKNIMFNKWERDEQFQPLEAICYAKRLEKDVFLITRFAYPNTQKDRDLFHKEIIPKMLQSITITPIKLSPWK